jgi:micrococcal nuclease
MTKDRIRWAEFWGKILFLLVLFLLLQPHPSPAQRLETGTVLRIIDGDTLNVKIQGKEECIRLIGIDAPESKANRKANRDSWKNGEDLQSIIIMGKKATTFTKALVKKDDTVKIEFDVQKRDKYNRLLAYVYLADGRMLNEEILKAGFASLMTIPPNVSYRGKFAKAVTEARENRRGLWH